MDPKFRVILERDRNPEFKDYIYRRFTIEPGFALVN